MRRIVLATRDMVSSTAIAGAVEATATVVRGEPELAGLKEAIRRVQPDLLIIDTDIATGVGSEMDAIGRGARDVQPGLRYVAVGDDTDAAAVLAAIRAGAEDFLGRDAHPGEVAERIARILQTAGRTERAEAGALSLIMSGRPNDGESAFAISLALLLANRTKDRGDTLLIDCSLPMSEADSALDLDLQYTLRDAINDMGRMDRTLLTSTLARHAASGLYVLPLSVTIEPIREVAANRLLALLDVLRGMFATTVLNLGGFRHSALLAQFCATATDLYLHTVQSFPSVKAAHAVLRQAGMSDQERARILLVTGDYQKDITFTDKQIATTLGLARMTRLPPTRAALLNGLNTGQMLTSRQPRSAYAQAVSRAVELAAPARTAPVRRARGGLLRFVPRLG